MLARPYFTTCKSLWELSFIACFDALDIGDISLLLSEYGDRVKEFNSDIPDSQGVGAVCCCRG